jgi:3-hydroxyisobutyrate dehydrogenase-like beta-hydroxyacid dehydrogenase
MPGGVDVVDAPVLGSVPQATEGRLRIFVGATDEQLERVRPVLEPMGTVIHLGGPGTGASMKLVANSTIGAAASALGEALAISDALGLRREQVLEILSDSPVGPTASGKRRNIEAHDYPANFKLELALKDLHLVHDEMQRAGRELRVAPGALAWFEQAAAEGHGDEDYSAVVETIAPAD